MSINSALKYLYLFKKMDQIIQYKAIIKTNTLLHNLNL